MRKIVFLFAAILLVLLAVTRTATATPPETAIPYEGYFVTCDVVDEGKIWQNGDRYFVRNERFVGESLAWEAGNPGAPIAMLTGTSEVRLHTDVNFATGEATVRAFYTLTPLDPSINGVWNGRATGIFTNVATSEGEFWYWAHANGDLAGYRFEAASTSVPPPAGMTFCGGNQPESVRSVAGTIYYPPGE